MKNDMLIKKLKKKKIYILSPHFDDAILSCGMFMHMLSGKNDLTVINIFTKAHEGPYTLSAKKFLKLSGYSDARKMYISRMAEDTNALKAVKAKRHNLGFVDSLFRRKAKLTILGKLFAEFDHIYPTYKWHITKYISKYDITGKSLKKILSKIIPDEAVVFVPYAVGNHADHMITRLSAEAVLKNIYYYIDFPYSLRLKKYDALPDGYQKMQLPIDYKIKSKLINFYSSQVKGMFPEGKIPRHNEIFLQKIIY